MMRKRWPFPAELVAVAVGLALVTVGFFWQILLTTDTWMPAGGGDLAPFLYPTYRFAAEQLRQGVIPLWNPHLYSGAPFAADIQSGLFYPINLLLFLLIPNFSYEWLEYLALFHFWLAGFTMYLCLRRLSINRPLSPPAALAGALAFQFSDLFIVHFGNLNMIAVAAWLPLIFWLFHRSLRQKSFGLAAASGAVLAIATLAGHIQITLFILLTLGLYSIFNFEFSIFSRNRPLPMLKRSKIIEMLRPFLLLLTVLLVMIGLSALLLLPAYEMSQYTPRAELPYQEAARYSLHPAQMVGLLIPDYFGRDPALHWGPWERVETGYIGILPLLLAIIGGLLYRHRQKIFFAGLAVIALLLAMGGYSLLHGWLYAIVPAFDQLRAPARFVLLLDFGLAVLAAFGVERLLQLQKNSLHEKFKVQIKQFLKIASWSLGGLIVVAAPLSYYAMLVTQDRNPVIFNRATAAASGVATFAFFTIAALTVLHLIHHQRLRGWAAGIAIYAVIVLDLFSLGANVDTGHTNPTTGFEHPEAITFLKNDPGLYRVEVTTDVWHLWQPNTALLHGLDDAWGIYNPLALADTSLYWQGAPPRNSGRYNFLGIKYIIASKAGAPADGNIIPVFDGDPAVNIYLNQSALARVQFVGQTVIMPNQDAVWTAIRADMFNPAEVVLLEQNQPPNTPPLPLETQPTSTLAIAEYGTNTVTVAVETDQAGYLVLSDAWYPGWQATVDGRPEPVYRANYAFRAVYVPAGDHTVRFTFEPLWWKIGLGVSGITLLVLLLWGLRIAKRKHL